MDDEGAPFVPDVRDRNRQPPDDEKAVDEEDIREEIDALDDEVPFVPMISARRDARLKELSDGAEDADDE